MATDSFKKGSVEMLTLFLLCEGDAHGYQLVQLIRERSGGLLTVQEGSLYPVLYRRTDEGCISAHETFAKTKTGRTRMRINYHIEQAGIDRLKELREEYENIHLGIRNIFTGEGIACEKHESTD